MSIRDMLLAALVVAVWGGNFVAAKLTVLYFPPFFSIALRFLGVALLLAPFLKKPTRNDLYYFLLIALTLGVLYFSFLFAGLKAGISIPAVILVTQLGVPFSCVMGTYFFNDRLGMWRTLGMMLSFMGLMLVAGTPSITEHMLAFFLTVISAFFWASSNVILKKMGKVQVFQMLGWMSVFATPALLLLSVLFEPVSLPLCVEHAPLITWLALLYTIFGSTLLLPTASGITSMQKHEISQVMPFNLLSPVIGISARRAVFP